MGQEMILTLKWYVVILALCLCSSAHGAFERVTQGARSVSMGGALVAEVRSAWGAFTNPSSIATISQRTISLHYSPEPFGLKELAEGAFSYVEPTGLGAFALSGSRFGFELYREVTLTGSFSRPITDRLLVGLNLHYYSLAIQNYGSGKTFGIDLGMLVEVSDGLRWGFSTFNINAPVIGQAKEKLPQIFSTGISYQPIDDATIALSLVKDIRYDTEVDIGFEYTLVNIVALRGGTTSDPSVLMAGIGIHYSIVQLDYAFSNHPDLGNTHQASLSLILGDF
jgi:hypothetical protein